MNYLASLVICLTLCLVGASLTKADCGPRPITPALPDGSAAGPEEMKQGLDLTSSFSETIQAHADCLIAAAQAAEDQRNALIDAAQMAIDDRNTLVENWNTEAQKFKARLSD